MLLEKNREIQHGPHNQFYPSAGLPYMDSLLSLPQSSPGQIAYCKYLKSNILMESGREAEAIAILEDLVKDDRNYALQIIWKDLAIAYLRLGERANCISNHAAESCILPIKGMGVHSDPAGSRKAIGVYGKLLQMNPDDLESRWLLNLAHMTLGEYPKGVTSGLLIPGMEGDTTYRVKPFQDIAADLKLDVMSQSGGSVVEDFDNDGDLDIMTSGWGADESICYFKNNADGTFSDLSKMIGLQGITGGLNMIQADYNNDGFMDVFVLRGAWKTEFGREPNSLLKNNGDGTFMDVTSQAGLLSFHPTQTATWNDFNDDGWLDLFIGNESTPEAKEIHPCELFVSNRDGTFREVSQRAHCDVMNFVKGVTSGDYDNDGWPDIFLSTMKGKRFLLHNEGKTDGEISFKDVSESAGVARDPNSTFATWFWDYDNDGWLDIFACDYTLKRSLAYNAAAEKLNVPTENKERTLLYRNNHDGTFTNVAKQVGLNKVIFAMGSNFGDIDNDGFLDMYLGTGNPDYASLVPNKMFRNIEGRKFADVTYSARVGHLQKGHGVSFADMDNDGDQDIYIEMGGAYPGDAYQNSFFLNPGQNSNSWICLKLEGKKSNRAAIGTRIEITFKDGDVSRTVYRDVNSGGSFGCSPMRKEIGLGQCRIIDVIKIRWEGSGLVQTFKNVKPNQFLKITEGSEDTVPLLLKEITWILPNQICPPQ